MQTEKIPKSSFFDDEDSNLKFLFQTPDPKTYKDLKLPHTVRDKLSMKSTHQEAIEETSYALHGKILAQYKVLDELVLEFNHYRMT